MKRGHGLSIGVIIAIAVAVFVPRMTQRTDPPAPRTTATAPAGAPAAPSAPAAAQPGSAPLVTGAIRHPEIGFHSRERLREHFEKHGRDFGAASPEQYLAQAQAFRDRPSGGDLLEMSRGDGVVTRFDRSTGAFIAFDRDLTIRTFFKPNDGEAYFKRQLERDLIGR